MTETLDSLATAPVPGEPAAVLAELIEPAPSEQAAEPVVAELASQRRQHWAHIIRDEPKLPAALRDRLAAVVEDAANVESDAEPQLTISQVAKVFAESLPSLLALERPRTVAAHPAGEGFFRAGQLSDDDAARIAKEQLARTGFAKSA